MAPYIETHEKKRLRKLAKVLNFPGHGWKFAEKLTATDLEELEAILKKHYRP